MRGLALALLVACAVTAAAAQGQAPPAVNKPTGVTGPGSGQQFIFLPHPDKVNLDGIFNNASIDGTVRRLYLQHLIAATPPSKLRSVLEPFATPNVTSRLQMSPTYLLDHPEQIVPYLAHQDQDDVMLLLGSMLQERQLDPKNLTTGQQTQLRQALDSGKLAAWVAQRYRNGKPGPDALVKASKTQPAALPPAPALSQAQLAAYQPPFPKLATGNGSIRVSSPPQTLDDMLAMIAHFNPKSGVKEPKQLGRLDGFKPLTIPIVFHLLGYKNQNGTYLPPYHWWADGAAQNIVNEVNKFYRGTGFSFKMQEVRWDPRKYPYLNRGDLLGWQDCGKDCWENLSSRFNVQGGPINLWVAGSFEGAFKCPPIAILCQMGANGLTTVNPGASEDWKPGYENLPTQVVYINYDRFSPDVWNRKSAWEGGGVVVAHEIAHYFGALHTFEGGCTPTNDAVTDTPRNLAPDAGWEAGWIIELNQFCRDWRNGKSPDPKWLLKIKSCPNAGGPRVIDNVFNLESYLDDECRMAFTENQVARMQWVVLTYRPGLLAKYGKAR